MRPDEAERWWTKEFAAAPEIETREVRIIAGAIIPLWQRLKTEGDAKLRVVRVSTEDGRRIVGVEIPRARVGRVLRSLGLGRPPVEPEKVFTRVLEEGEEICLVCDLKLKRSALHRDPAIELVCWDPDKFGEFRDLGLINEQIKFKQRLFVPTEEHKGISIIAELLFRYPVIEPEDTTESPETENVPIIEAAQAAEASFIELEQWVLPPEEPCDPPISQDEEISTESTSSFFESPFPEQIGPPISALLEQYAPAMRVGRRKPRPVSDEQGVLFALN